MKYAVTTAPSTEPVTLTDVKLHLRTVTGDTSEDAGIITPLIQAAREYCENVTGRALASQTIKAYPDSWGLWRLPRPPIASITSVKYYDTDDTENTLAATAYQFDAVDGLILIHDKPAVTLRDLNPIVVEYVSGYTADNKCPMTVRQAMLLLIAYWYAGRGDTTTVDETTEQVVKRLLKQYKVWWY